jgi:hypothetical protein
MLEAGYWHIRDDEGPEQAGPMYAAMIAASPPVEGLRAKIADVVQTTVLIGRPGAERIADAVLTSLGGASHGRG